MADLPFPASAGVLEAFLERMRFSPRAQVTIDWLVGSLGISQRPNAGRTLRWLGQAGLIDDVGFLTERGCALLLPTNPEYRACAADAIKALLTDDQQKRLRTQRLSRVGLQKELRQKHGVGTSAANKAIGGILALAQIADDPALTKALAGPGFDKHEPTYPEVNIEEAKAAILERFELFTGGTGGIDGWLNVSRTPEITFERLTKVAFEPLTASQFNQLLTLAHAAPLSAGFFRYYWLSKPPHPYDLTSIPGFSPEWDESLAIFNLDQLHWGLYRFYVDALLFFGNVRSAYQILRTMEYQELCETFSDYRIDPTLLVERGPALPLTRIERDDRYLISEMACKSYAPSAEDGVGLEAALREAYEEHAQGGRGPITAGELLGDAGTYILRAYGDKQAMFRFAADEILDEAISSIADLERLLEPIKIRFARAREAALGNTERYLSSVGDLDVYVATSMRSRSDFYAIADLCETVFGGSALRNYNLRYFDPTLSAAENHEDKGLIECLMVKCAKFLLYTAGDGDSYGKDAEAAMALSLGKPVIFFCSSSKREQFFRDVHPLSRLVNFETGVAVGAMVTDNDAEVITLLERLLTNQMQYELHQKRPGYLVLKERTTDCVVRLQTSYELLRETFWNHYHGSRPEITR